MAEPRWLGATTLATGAGLKGPWQQNDSSYDYVDDPSVALAPEGGAAFVWVEQRSKDVWFQRPGSAPVNVSRSPQTFSWLPRVAFPPASPRTVHVLWQEIIFSGGSHGGDILFATSADGGASFATPLNLSRSVGGDGKGRVSRDHWDNGSFDLALGGDGAVHAAWTTYEGELFLAQSLDEGESFSTPRRIAGDAARPARAPSLALGPDRTLYLAWTHGEDRTADIQLTRSTDGGARFEAPRAIARTPAFSDAPRLLMDRRGTLHLAFADGDRILHAYSTDGARSFTPPRPVSGGGAGFPAIGVDHAGNVCVVWERMEGGRPVALEIAVSRDQGRTFAPPAVVPGSEAPAGGSNGSQQGRLTKKLAVAPDGRIAVVNSSLEPGKRSRVWRIDGKL